MRGLKGQLAASAFPVAAFKDITEAAMLSRRQNPQLALVGAWVATDTTRSFNPLNESFEIDRLTLRGSGLPPEDHGTATATQCGRNGLSQHVAERHQGHQLQRVASR